MTSARTILTAQLEIPWSLATRYCFPVLSDQLAAWEPSARVCGLVKRAGQVFAEWPDEASTPLPDVTVGWLLWHIEFWWGDAVRGVAGKSSSDPLTVPWSGSVAKSVARITELHDTWVTLLGATPLAHVCAGPWPTPQPLSTIAGWVNVELMKNVAEMGQLVHLHANQAERDGELLA